MNYRLTHIGKLCLLVIVLLYFASLTSLSGLLLSLVGIVLGCFAINFIYARSALQGLQIEPPKTLVLGEGQRMTQPWKIINRTRQPAGFIQISMSMQKLFQFPLIAAGRTISQAPELCLAARGVYPLRNVRCVSTYPFGLVAVARSMELEGEILVCPALYETEAPHASGYDVMVGGKHKGLCHSTSGSDFAGIRPIQPGDPMKQIHWPSSAKGQGLMVKLFEQELSGRAAFVLDTGHTGHKDILDNALRAAGSMMFAALDAGHHVEWIGLHEGSLHVIPPFDDGQELLEALARIPLQPGCMTAEKIAPLLRLISPKCSIHLVLTDFPPGIQEVVDELVQNGRQVILYLPKADSQAVPSFNGRLLFYAPQGLFA